MGGRGRANVRACLGFYIPELILQVGKEVSFEYTHVLTNLLIMVLRASLFQTLVFILA